MFCYCSHLFKSILLGGIIQPIEITKEPSIGDQILMPISDYDLTNRIFFAKEVGVIDAKDAEDWSNRLREAAVVSKLPIVALVDALDVKILHYQAEQIFAKTAYTDNLLAVIVATSSTVSIQARAIGLLGKRGHTRIFSSLEEARQVAEEIVKNNTKKPE